MLDVVFELDLQLPANQYKTIKMTPSSSSLHVQVSFGKMTPIVLLIGALMVCVCVFDEQAGTL